MNDDKGMKKGILTILCLGYNYSYQPSTGKVDNEIEHKQKSTEKKEIALDSPCIKYFTIQNLCKQLPDQLDVEIEHISEQSTNIKERAREYTIIRCFTKQNVFKTLNDQVEENNEHCSGNSTETMKLAYESMSSMFFVKYCPFKPSTSQLDKVFGNKPKNRMITKKWYVVVIQLSIFESNIGSNLRIIKYMW